MQWHILFSIIVAIKFQIFKFHQQYSPYTLLRPKFPGHFRPTWEIRETFLVNFKIPKLFIRAKFLQKCLALHPICLKTFVVLKVCSSIYRLYPLWLPLIWQLNDSSGFVETPTYLTKTFIEKVSVKRVLKNICIAKGVEEKTAFRESFQKSFVKSLEWNNPFIDPEICTCVWTLQIQLRQGSHVSLLAYFSTEQQKSWEAKARVVYSWGRKAILSPCLLFHRAAKNWEVKARVVYSAVQLRQESCALYLPTFPQSSKKLRSKGKSSEQLRQESHSLYLPTFPQSITKAEK